MKKQKDIKYLFGPVATQFNNVQTGQWSVVKPFIDQSKCKLCKQCVIFCPTASIRTSSDKEGILCIEFDYCKGCGICVNVCPNKCISMVRYEV